MSLLGTLQAMEATRNPSGGIADLAMDFAFEMRGDILPFDYPAQLDLAMHALLPAVDKDPFFAIHAVKAPLTETGYVLSRRSRLQLRALESKSAEIEQLVGKTLHLGDVAIVLGSMTRRPVTPFPTLRSGMVVNLLGDEQAFMDDIGMQLEVLGVKAGAMCGKPHTVMGHQGRIEGYALVLHDLSPAHSVRVQTVGLGGSRRLGCGLFVHHKVIDGPEAWPE